MLTFLTTSTGRADIWHVDFNSSRLHGSFDVLSSTFTIPATAISPTTFQITSADFYVTGASPMFGQLHYTATDVTNTNCAPAECRIIFKTSSAFIPNYGTYDLFTQLNFEKIWVPWLNADQQNIQVWFHTEPHVLTFAWNDVATANRTVVTENVAGVPETSTWILLLIGFAMLAHATRRASNFPRREQHHRSQLVINSLGVAPGALRVPTR